MSAATPNSPVLNDPVAEFTALANNFEAAFFDHYPEIGMFWGREDVAQDRFSDHSLQADLAWQQKEDEFLLALSTLDEHVLKESHEYVTYQQLRETLKNSQSVRVCKENLWNVNPTLLGWPMFTIKVAEKQRVGTPEYREMALKRWRTFPIVVDDEINKLKAGVVQGYTAPKTAVNMVLKQLDILIHSQPTASPYFDFARRDGDAAFQTQVTQLIETTINPALQRYADYLRTNYLTHARDEIGVSVLPNGASCYQAKVKKETTLDISPTDIYEFGLQHMEELNKEVVAIGAKLFGLQDMAEIFQQAQHRTEYLFQSEQAMLDYNFAALARAKSTLPDWFGTISSIECTIKPYPAYRAQTGAPGEYAPPSEDGTEPGIFYINTDQPNKRSRVDQEATLFHELLPGHHMQIAVALGKRLHSGLDGYLWNSGFGEGWALYAERLADEMGLYSDDIARLGMLSNEALRTARLVVDPGMHVMGWSKEQAMDYLKKHTALTHTIIEGEVDRYIMLPGQATAYMLGKREIEHLRHMAEERLQHDFAIRDFHDQLLKYGAVTLPMLKAQIQSWLANQPSLPRG